MDEQKPKKKYKDVLKKRSNNSICIFCNKEMGYGKIDRHHINGRKEDKQLLVHYNCHHNFHSNFISKEEHDELQDVYNMAIGEINKLREENQKLRKELEEYHKDSGIDIIEGKQSIEDYKKKVEKYFDKIIKMVEPNSILAIKINQYKQKLKESK